MTLELDVALQRAGFDLSVAFAAATSGVTALYGPSGAGKTTIGQMVAGLVQPDHGRISVNGRVLFDSARGIQLPVHRRRVGMVFQDSRLFPHLSVESNLRYGLERAPGGGSDVDFDSMVALLGLEHLLTRRPGGLSGGERQRTAIGRALLSRPDILVLDEPLAALDFARRGEILDFIAALKHQVGLPMIYISHAVDEVARLADHLIVLDQGRVRASGQVSDLLSSPELVAHIAGDGWGALIEGRVAGQDLTSGLTEIAFPGGRIKVPPIRAAMGHKVRLRIPARDVIVALTPVTGLSVQNCLPAVVSELAEVANGQVDVILALGPTRLAARVTAGAVRRLNLAPGIEVFALIKSAATDRLM